MAPDPVMLPATISECLHGQRFILTDNGTKEWHAELVQHIDTDAIELHAVIELECDPWPECHIAVIEEGKERNRPSITMQLQHETRGEQRSPQPLEQRVIVSELGKEDLGLTAILLHGNESQHVSRSPQQSRIRSAAGH